MAKLPFMTGRYKWFLKVLSVCAEFKGEDTNAECRRPTSAKEYNITTDNPALLEKTGIGKSADKKVKIYTPVKTHFYNEKSSKLPFMAGCYEWFLKALPVCECQSVDANAEQREPTSTKEKQKDTADLENSGKESDGKNKPNKVFNDPIHGHIQLHPLLVKIIDTPEFQRLRNIKQLGGVYFVYPGASHNRFEHSIGVAHLAGELAKALRTKQLQDLKSECEETKLKESLISDRDILCVQIAGLCHDLGHGPFSHLFDGMFIPEVNKASKEGKEGKEGKEEKWTIAGLFCGLGHRLCSYFCGGISIPASKEEKWTHEEASIKMFDHLLEKNKLIPVMKEYNLKVEGEDENDLTFIRELINGPKNETAQNEWPYKGRKREKSFLYEIVSNKQNGIDVDKFDYFARDCHHLGIRSNFDHQRFIIFARVCNVNGQKQICSRDKEVANLYDLFHTRHSLHRRACQHKIKMAVEIMIKDALLKADQHIKFKSSEGEMLSISKAKDDMEAYTKLTDQVIETILNCPSPSLEEARKILQRVMTRDLYQCVGQATRKTKDQVEISEEMKESLEKKLLKDIRDISKDNFEITVVTFDYGMKDKDPISKAYFYRKNDTKKGIPISKSKVSRFLPEQFSEEILRLYWKNSENTDKAKKCFKTWCNENGFEVEEEDNDAAY